jgi:hypothetical protein
MSPAGTIGAIEIGGWPNLVAMFLSQAEKHGQQPFLWEKIDGESAHSAHKMWPIKLPRWPRR